MKEKSNGILNFVSIIITSYNYDYNGISSIRKAKEKNDYMAIRF